MSLRDSAKQWEKPDYASQTVFVAAQGVTDGQACYCQNREKSWEPLSDWNPYHCTWNRRRRPGLTPDARL